MLRYPHNNRITKSQICKPYYLKINNKELRNLGDRSLKASGTSHRCDVAVIGYGGDSVTSLWAGELAGEDIVSIVDIVKHPLGMITKIVNVSDGEGGLIPKSQKRKYWIESGADGLTPMGKALQKARLIVQQWLQLPRHQDSFPPVVIHVTDGLPSSENEMELALTEASLLKKLSTTDGNVLLLNIHVPDAQQGGMRLFPVVTSDLGDDADGGAYLLFEMSSVLSNEMIYRAEEEGYFVQSGCKLMIINADATALSKMMSFGTTTSPSSTR